MFSAIMPENQLASSIFSFSWVTEENRLVRLEKVRVARLRGRKGTYAKCVSECPKGQAFGEP